MKTKIEILIDHYKNQINETQIEYDEQKEAVKHFRTPSNPYIVGLATKLNCLKLFLEQLEEVLNEK